MSKEETKIFTKAEVEKHKTGDSLWIIIHNHVYDITKFLDEHPGGEEVLLEQGGQVATEVFEDVGHSDDARELMKEYHIGELTEEDKEPEHNVYEMSEESRSSYDLISWVIPATITVAIIAVAVYKMMST